MIFALLTFLTALSLAAVAGWFSIAGIMTIYAGAPLFAAVLGVVTECGKLVTISWLYRNWNDCTWKLKLPLIYFTIALMVITSIGVFGFLSKAHLEQNSSTIDNSARVEQLNRQIERERAVITDSEKLVAQLDSTVNSFLGKDRTDRSLAVRKSQAPQRAQLRKEISEAQARIDQLSEEKFKYESEIRKLELEVGPIRYVAEMIYGKDGDGKSHLESAVKIFTLLVVSTLDPLASVLLIAANSSWQRRKKKDVKKEESPTSEDKKISQISEDSQQERTDEGLPVEVKTPIWTWPEIEDIPQKSLIDETNQENIESSKSLSGAGNLAISQIENSGHQGTVENKEESSAGQSSTVVAETYTEEPSKEDSAETVVEHSVPVTGAWAQQKDVLSGILGSQVHFVPEKVNPVVETKKTDIKSVKDNKYPSISSWIDKFGEQDGKRARKVN